MSHFYGPEHHVAQLFTRGSSFKRHRSNIPSHIVERNAKGGKKDVPPQE